MPTDDDGSHVPLSEMLSGLRLDELLAEVQQRLADAQLPGRPRCGCGTWCSATCI